MPTKEKRLNRRAEEFREIFQLNLARLKGEVQSQAFIDKEDIIKLNGICPVCHSTSPKNRIGTIQKEPEILLLECPDCRACSASAMPRDEVLYDFYAKEFPRFDEEESFVNYSRLASHLASRINLEDHQIIRILDFGGGTGNLSRELVRYLAPVLPESRFIITVVDIIPRDEEANSQYSLQYRQNLTLVESEQHVVLASAVLEHIPDLYTTLHGLFNVLSPGGYFYARTPWHAPFKRLIPALDLGYPVHVHDLGAPFWNRILETFGLKADFIFSKTSVVQTEFRYDFFQTFVSFAFKIPGFVEAFLLPGIRKDPLWRWSGGWEVLLRKMS